MLRNEELLKFGACDGMSQHELTQLAEAMQWREHPVGYTLFVQGDESTSMFFLHRGNIAIEMEADGREELLAELAPYTIVGEMGALLEQPRSAIGRATTEIGVGVLHRHTLLEWIEDGEPVAMHLILNVMKIMASRIRKVNAKLFELSGSEQVGQTVRAELAEFRQKLFTTWSF